MVTERGPLDLDLHADVAPAGLDQEQGAGQRLLDGDRRE